MFFFVVKKRVQNTGLILNVNAQIRVWVLFVILRGVKSNNNAANWDNIPMYIFGDDDDDDELKNEFVYFVCQVKTIFRNIMI